MTPEEHEAAQAAAGILALQMQNDPVADEGGHLLADTTDIPIRIDGNLQCLDVALRMVAHTEKVPQVQAPAIVALYIEGMLRNIDRPEIRALLRDSQEMLRLIHESHEMDTEVQLGTPFDNDSRRIGPALGMALWAAVKLLAIRHDQTPAEAGKYFALRIAQMAPSV